MNFEFKKYSVNNVDNKFTALVEAGTSLSKFAMNSLYKEDSLSTKYAVDLRSTSGIALNYQEANKEFVNKLYQYCLEGSPSANLGLDVNNRANVVRMFSDPFFAHKFFAIQSEILIGINSDNEVEEALQLANVSNVGLGDSKAFQIESKALWKIQDHGWENNVSDAQKQFKSSIYVTPRRKSAKITMEIEQASALDYDFGKQIAKLAMSLRKAMYNDIIDIIFTVANVSSTPFYQASFSKTTYVTVVDQLAATNSANVRAYGSRLAFVNMTNGVTTGFQTQDEINKTGFLGNVYGTPFVVINQVVDSNSALFTTKVPTNRILLVSDVGDKPVKLVREDGMRYIVKDGTDTSLFSRSYTVIDSWKAALATQASYGIIVVA